MPHNEGTSRREHNLEAEGAAADGSGQPVSGPRERGQPADARYQLPSLSGRPPGAPPTVLPESPADQPLAAEPAESSEPRPDATGPSRGTQPAAQSTVAVAPADGGGGGPVVEPGPEPSRAPAISSPGPPTTDGSGPDNSTTRELPPSGPQPELRHVVQLTDDEDERRRLLLDAAVGYAQRGWAVIQVWWVDENGICQCYRKAECTSPGKHPILSDWPTQALQDPVDVAEWWTPPTQWREVPEAAQFHRYYPLANIGVVTGRISKIVVLDEDPRNGGEDTLIRLIDQHGDLPLTRIHTTGSGGQHIFGQYPEPLEIGNSSQGRAFGPGLDIKGNGGFVVVPPSISGAGPYYIANPVHDTDPAPLPDWVTDRLAEFGKQQAGYPSDMLNAPIAPNGLRRKYGRNAVKGQAENLAKTGQGGRNSALNAAAFSLGQLQPGGIVDEDTAWEALREAVAANGLLAEDGEAQCRRTFLSGWNKGIQNPYHPDWQSAQTTWPLRTWDSFGHGQRMVDHFADVLRWSPALETWRAYRNGIWSRRCKEEGDWYAQMMIDSLERTEALGYDDVREDPDKPSPREKFLAFTRKARNIEHVTAAARMAHAHEAMRINEDYCDTDPLLINLLNGTWDALRGILLPHDPDHLLTLQANVAYDPDAMCPKWDEFFERVQPDAEVRAYLYRVAGYSSTSDISEEAVFLHHGTGANGKSTWHDVLSRILGSYAQAVPIETLLLKRNDGQVPTDVARMTGKRYLSAKESKEGKKLDEAKIKELTSSEFVAARYMRQDFFEFRPTGKVHLTSNHLVHLSDDDATWRRLQLIPWEVFIPEGERDRHLAEMLFATEAAGILNRILAGLQDWLDQSGLCLPDVLAEALARYRTEEDMFGHFVEQCLEVLPGDVDSGVGQYERTSSYLHHQVYSEWVRRSGAGEKPMYINTFVKRLKERGYPQVRKEKWRGFPTLRPIPQWLAQSGDGQ